MQLDEFKKSRLDLVNGFYKPIFDKIKALPKVDVKINLGDIIEINGDIDLDLKSKIDELSFELRDWRKGPFNVFDTFIDAEWQSNIKYNLIEPYLDLDGKSVADIGCNNGYYLFRMLNKKPKELVGFDPGIMFYAQFLFLNHFIRSKIDFELLGVQHLNDYQKKFDLILCLGVLYHRSDPVVMLKDLKNALEPDGELILDTIIIDGNDDVVLFPKDTYAKMRNVYFLPTVNALKNMLSRAGFSNITVLEIKATDLNEQRKTKWIKGYSLENFLDPADASKTIEGYPAPKRVYIKGKRS